MAFLEWRKFHFFDLKKDVDDGKLAQLFKESKVAVTSSGNNQIVLGDSTGLVYLLSRSWHATIFRAYEMSVDLVQQMRNSPLLITIGQDEPGVNPLIKVWDTSRLDKNTGIPYCCRISRAIPGNRPVHASCLCVHDSLQIMAVGFADGSLVLYRGDVTRDRSSKPKLLRDSSSIVTGLAFKSTATNTLLFLATDSSVIVYNITHKDKEAKFILDNFGCARRCSVLAESMVESHFMVGRNDAIYCYTVDGRGPCYAVDGEKVMIEWFRSYLIIISKITRPNIAPMTNENLTTTNQGNLITVLDIHNKFIVFSAIVPPVRSILIEWGVFYILDNDNRLYHLDEKDLQSKLSLLFKKNLYDVAIRIAKSQQYDSDGLVNIFRQYGDHLCDKGDFVGAIEQYIKTIGKLEPSSVIRKFLDSQHIEKLTMYLEALHKQGQATEDHTTLLLNCYTKLNNTGQCNSLKEFVLMKESDLSYDVDVAIKVCRQGSPSEALWLSKKHEKHDWYIKLQIEDHRRYVDVLDYISTLSFENAECYMKKYGNILIQKAPHESTQFLKRLCTNYRSNTSLENSIIGSFDIAQKSDPEDYIHLFLNNSEQLVEFLEYLIGEECILSPPVYNTLIEHYLHVWGASKEVAEKNKYAQKILKHLQNTEVKYDKSQALVVCHMHSFSDGILYLYEEQKLYQQILKHHISKNDSNAILACCRRFGHQEPTLWVQALWSCVRDSNTPSFDLLNEILTVIAKERLLSPQLVVDTLGSGNAEITLGHIRSYISNELQQEQKKTKEIGERTQNYRKDTEKLKKDLDILKSGSIVIQGSRCAACHHPLELPTIHFLCQHSYHQHCFQSFSDEENECPSCQPENKSLLELLKAREYTKDLHETFHSQLEKAHDGFSVAAEYFGRGVFNKYKVIRDEIIEASIAPPKVEMAQKTKPIGYIPEPEVRNYGPGAEGRLRQTEKPAGNIIIPQSEGRIRVQENRYSSSLEANITNFTPKNYESSRKKDYVDITGTNPFEEYDESKNPFAAEEVEDDEYDKNNPFRDECDKNSNPFYK